MTEVKISDIKPGMRNLTVTGKVLSVSKPKTVRTRYGLAEVASALIEDDSGRITLTLWRAQIQKVKPGYVIKIEGAYVTVFRGKIQLNVSRRGRITVLRKE